MADITEIKDYYANLLIIQYQDKPKASAVVQLFIQELLANGVFFDIRDGYALDTAVGLQLDIIAKYIGTDRFFVGQDFLGYYSLINYDEVSAPPVARIGLANYTDWETKTGKILTYFSMVGVATALTDEDFRTLLHLKVLQNNTIHSHKTINDGLFKLFGSTVLAESTGNMEMNYYVPTQYNSVAQVALSKDILPRPMGVKIAHIIARNEPFFGFIEYGATSAPLIKGFSDYTDFGTISGDCFTYGSVTAL